MCKTQAVFALCLLPGAAFADEAAGAGACEGDAFGGYVLVEEPVEAEGSSGLWKGHSKP